MKKDAKKSAIIQNVIEALIPIVVFIVFVIALTIMTAKKDNGAMLVVGSSLIPMITAIICGYLISKRVHISAFFAGVIAGIVVMVAFLALSSILYKAFPDSMQMLMLSAKIFPAAILGAILALSRRPRKRKTVQQ